MKPGQTSNKLERRILPTWLMFRDGTLEFTESTEPELMHRGPLLTTQHPEPSKPCSSIHSFTDNQHLPVNEPRRRWWEQTAVNVQNPRAEPGPVVGSYGSNNSFTDQDLSINNTQSIMMAIKTMIILIMENTVSVDLDPLRSGGLTQFWCRVCVRTVCSVFEAEVSHVVCLPVNTRHRDSEQIHIRCERTAECLLFTGTYRETSCGSQ